MTFYYEEDTDTLRGNVADEYAHFEDDGTLVIDVEYIIAEGRSIGKLREMQRAIDDAIAAHPDEAEKW